MKNNNLLIGLGLVGVGAAYLLLGSGSAGAANASGATNPFSLLSGKTYQITMRAVGGKISDQEVTDNVNVIQALGSTVKSHSLNDSRDTLTLTVTMGRDSRILLNKFYPNPANQQVGVIFTSAKEVDETPVGMANPASVYCVEQGGRNEIVTDTQGNQRGYCVLPDGSRHDEWAFFRGEVGPKKT